MKSCLGILIIFFTFVAVVGGGAAIWYLSNTAEFSRTPATATGQETPPPAPPRAQVVPQRQQPKPATPKPAPKPAAPQRPSSPFGDSAPPPVSR